VNGGHFVNERVVLEGELRADGRELTIDGLDVAEEVGHTLDAERNAHGGMTRQQLGRVRVTIERIDASS